MVITNLIVETMAGETIENGFIFIEGEKIAAIGKMSEYKGDMGEELDFSGCYALPGLIDAHSHLGLFGDSLGFEGEDGNEVSDPVTPQLCAIDGINALDRGFSEALDYGVTTVITGPGSANAISGQSAAVKTFGCCVDDMVIKPRLAMKLALGENPKNTYSGRSQAPCTRMTTAALIREELFRARRYQEDIERWQSDTEEYDAPEYDAKSEALLPVLRGEMPVHIHAHRVDDIFTAARIIKEFSLKGVIIHATEAHLVAERFAKEGIPVVCGPIMGTRSKPELAGMSRKGAALLKQNGVKTAICTDHPEMPQEFLMLSAAIAHSEGMSREDALGAITIFAAEISGLENRIGSLKAGKDADIVIYQNDPILGLEKPRAVFLNGKRVR
ncbi:MAG: amidohydrolase [Oscillospiraceae bacterium]|nr:amidohydrolase [Oscillospiraceae bacterium]